LVDSSLLRTQNPDKIDWTWLGDELADCFSDEGRPAEPVRFMLGMFMLKHTYGLSDEQV
jgi:IS5 family transposase